MYTHVVVARPDLVHEQLLLLHAGWGNLRLVSETRTAQATVLVYETEEMLGGIEVNDLVHAAGDVWHFDGNFNGSAHQQRMISL